MDDREHAWRAAEAQNDKSNAMLVAGATAQQTEALTRAIRDSAAALKASKSATWISYASLMIALVAVALQAIDVFSKH